MEVKIKQGGVMIDATIEMIDGVMVVSPKEVKSWPNDGDVLTYLNKGKPIIYVYRVSAPELTFYYVAYSHLKDVVYIPNETDVLYKWVEDVRPATEEEKKLLFDKLAEKGWSWDAEKKELVKLKWKPKEGEAVYVPMFVIEDGFGFYFESQKQTMRNDFQMYLSKEMCFKTEEECQAFCQRLNEAINSVKP